MHGAPLLSGGSFKVVIEGVEKSAQCLFNHKTLAPKVCLLGSACGTPHTLKEITTYLKFRRNVFNDLVKLCLDGLRPRSLQS